jgi:hypothetical protein
MTKFNYGRPKFTEGKHISLCQPQWSINVAGNEKENSAVVSHFMKCIFDYNGNSYRLSKKVCTKETPVIFLQK